MTFGSEGRREIGAPLSEPQRSLWHFERLGRLGLAHHVQTCLQVEGPLNPDLLRQGFNEVVARHEALRTRVELVDGHPTQYLYTKYTLPLHRVDLSHLISGNGDSEAHKRMQVWAREPFDLCEDLLIRARLIRLAPERHWVHIIAHQFVCNEESMKSLARELTRMYVALADGRDLPPRHTFAFSQELPGSDSARAHLAAERTAYWKDRLPKIAQHRDSREANGQTPQSPDYTVGVVKAKVSIPPNLPEFCQAQQIELPELALSVFAIMRSRQAGKKEVPLSLKTVASDRAGRTQEIGPVADTLLLTVIVESDCKILDVIREVKRAYATALNEAPVPSDVIIEAVGSRGDSRVESLTDVLFEFKDDTYAELPSCSVSFGLLEAPVQFGCFDLECRVGQEHGHLNISFVYRKNVYDATTIKDMLAQYQYALEVVATEANQSIDRLFPAAPVQLDRQNPPDLLLPAGEAEKKERQPFREAIELKLTEVWTELLRGKQFGPHDNFFALGGDSILSILMVTKARQRGLHLTPRQVFQHQTISSLAGVAVLESPVMASPARSAVAESIGLTPIQQWYFERQSPHLSHFNLSALLEARRSLDAASVIAAIRAVIAHHDSLRLRFKKEGGKWSQSISQTDGRSDCLYVDLSRLAAEQRTNVVKAIAARLQTTVDIEKGPLARAAWFEFGKGSGGQLLVIAHHLAVDGVSWRILMEDLETACLATMHQEVPALPPVITSYREWVETLNEQARSEAVRAELNYWLKILRTPVAIPFDLDDGRNTESSARKVSVVFDRQTTTAFLQKRAETSEVWIQQALLASLGRALTTWIVGSEVRIDVEGHGRDLSFEADVSRTVGWFTVLYPLQLNVDSDAGPEDSLAHIRKQLKLIPRRGIGYGLLRYLNPDPGIRKYFADTETAKICFNYLGRFDHLWSEKALFRRLDRPEALKNGDADRPYLLQIEAQIEGEELQVHWEYSDNLHRRETIQGLADHFRDSMLEFVDFECAVDENEHLRKIDLAALNQKQLASVIAALDSSEDQ